MTRYPVTSIFRTVQGEGALLGVPMVFVRLAGCSVGCPQCDTDYGVRERLAPKQIRERVEAVRGTCPWVWVTGGEPADHELWPLLEEMRLCGRVALATSGTKGLGAGGRLVDFLSVSPHGPPGDMVLNRGSQLNLVPGLNGLKLGDWKDFPTGGFGAAFVTPCDGQSGSVAECVRFVEATDGRFRLGVQAHKLWGLP